MENKQKGHLSRNQFEVCVPTYVSLRMFIMQVLASQLHFLANRNAELAIPPLFWPVNCLKIGGNVALFSDPTFYSLYCGHVMCPRLKSETSNSQLTKKKTGTGHFNTFSPGHGKCCFFSKFLPVLSTVFSFFGSHDFIY